VAAAIFIKLTLVEEAFLAPAIEEKTTLFKQAPEVKTAMDHMEKGRTLEAIRHLQTALRSNPEDIDALHLLGQCYRDAGKPTDAATAYRRKMRSHLKREEKDLAADTYMEMIEASPKPDLTPREILSIGPVLAEYNFHAEAIELYRRLLEKDTQPQFRLKASLALSDLYLQDYKGHLALEVLTSVVPLVESSPEWKDYLQKKIAAVQRVGAQAPARE
jgi:tetratricopeptide (TPR) repeat protein